MNSSGSGGRTSVVQQATRFTAALFWVFLGTIVLGTGVLGTTGQSARGETLPFRTQMDQAQVVRPGAFQPPVLGTGSPGIGLVELRMDTDAQTFHVEITVLHIEPGIVDSSIGPNLTGLHIHSGAADARGPVILDVHHFARLLLPESDGMNPIENGFEMLAEGPWETQQGEFDAGISFGEFVDSLTSGNAFVALHTTTNSLTRTGAIRGQLAAAAPPFRRADCNGDDFTDSSDAIFMIQYIFNSGPSGSCVEACNTNDDGRHDVGDPVYLLNALFRQGPAIPAPSPNCAIDVENAPLGCDQSPCS